MLTALSHGAELLILDEPTSGLDVSALRNFGHAAGLPRRPPAVQHPNQLAHLERPGETLRRHLLPEGRQSPPARGDRPPARCVRRPEGG